MGRAIPTEEGAEHERELQIVATKGIISLFNAVTEFQTTQQKDQLKEEREKKIKRTAGINSLGSDKTTGAVGMNQTLIDKIQSTQRKWKVLEDDSEDEFGNIKVVDDE